MDDGSLQSSPWHKHQAWVRKPRKISDQWLHATHGLNRKCARDVQVWCLCTVINKIKWCWLTEKQLLQTDCIYNSPGANIVSRAKTPPPYLRQQQRENSYNSIYRVQRTIWYRTIHLQERRSLNEGVLNHGSVHLKNPILIHNTSGQKCTSIKLEMASRKKTKSHFATSRERDSEN